MLSNVALDKTRLNTLGYLMKRTFLMISIALFFVAGYYLGRKRYTQITPVIAQRTSALGLKRNIVDYGTKRVIQFWIAFGLEGSKTGEDMVYFQREIPLENDEVTNIKNAVQMLLEGPLPAEKQLRLYSLVPGGKIKNIAFRDKKLTLNFSKDFSPGGGSLAMWQLRTAVEEVVRQFPDVRTLEILVEGRSAALEP